MHKPNLLAAQHRAILYQRIRAFFAERDVLEIETPLLCTHTVTDPHIQSFSASNRFLQTSPEYCMKRFLVEHPIAIYQLCKAFRFEEAGTRHNPEFTLLEWYQPKWNHHQLMDGIDTLIQTLLHCPPSDKQTYRDTFIKHTSLDPFQDSTETLIHYISSHQPSFARHPLDHDTACQIILSECIEPKIGQERPYFIYDFPTTQAALAKIRPDSPPVAERFELFYRGFELANGFHELSDANEQKKRFENDQKQRAASGNTVPTIDSFFIEALKQGLTNCAGVAIGVDRLVMLMGRFNSIKDTLTFDWEHC